MASSSNTVGTASLECVICYHNFESQGKYVPVSAGDESCVHSFCEECFQRMERCPFGDKVVFSGKKPVKNVMLNVALDVITAQNKEIAQLKSAMTDEGKGCIEEIQQMQTFFVNTIEQLNNELSAATEQNNSLQKKLEELEARLSAQPPVACSSRDYQSTAIAMIIAKPVPSCSTDIMTWANVMTLEEVRQQYPRLQIVDETFWTPYQHLGIKLDRVPAFDHSAAEMTRVLDLFQTAGVVECDAGGTLLLLPEGLTLNMVLSMFVELGLSKGGNIKGNINHSLKRVFGSKANERSRWVLISNNVLNGSRKSYDYDDQKMVEDMGGNIPSLLATLVVLIATYKLQYGKRLFGDSTPWVTYTRIIESIDGYPIFVGNFTSTGPSVNGSNRIHDFGPTGIALALG